MEDSMLCSHGALCSWLRKKFMKFLPLQTDRRLRAAVTTRRSRWVTGPLVPVVLMTLTLSGTQVTSSLCTSFIVLSFSFWLHSVHCASFDILFEFVHIYSITVLQTHLLIKPLTWLHILCQRGRASKLICEPRAVCIMRTDESCCTADDSEDDQLVEANNRGVISAILRYLSTWRKWKRQ